MGHYYSYIKERSPGLRKGGDGEGCWWSFDDNHVEPWDPSSMDRDCFGGKTTLEVFDNAQQQQVIQV